MVEEECHLLEWGFRLRRVSTRAASRSPGDTYNEMWERYAVDSIGRKKREGRGEKAETNRAGRDQV